MKIDPIGRDEDSRNLTAHVVVRRRARIVERVLLSRLDVARRCVDTSVHGSLGWPNWCPRLRVVALALALIAPAAAVASSSVIVYDCAPNL
jgi:hypothetical protein